jgi:hypothetical protein
VPRPGQRVAREILGAHAAAASLQGHVHSTRTQALSLAAGVAPGAGLALFLMPFIGLGGGRFRIITERLY